MASPAPAPADAQQQQAGLQIQVRFITRDTSISIPDAPILVPSNLQRLGLSQVINHLLEPTAPIPFDFLIDGAFLRASLGSYLASNGLSSESVLTLEYVRAAVPPRFLASFQHDDWVSSVSVSPVSSSSPTAILSGSYDGIARVWNLSGEVLAEGSGHTSAIKAARWSGADMFVTGSMDRTLRLWRYETDAGTADSTAELLGHTSTINSLAVHSESQRLLSASADSTLRLWSLDPSRSPAAPREALPRTTKKRKLGKGGSEERIPQLGALATLGGHASPVSSVLFAPTDASVAYSAGWDHTLRTWDLATGSGVDVRATQHPLLSLCALSSLGVLAAGTAARHVTLHDPRVSAAQVTAGILRGHTNAVVAVAGSPVSEWGLVSAGHDGTVRVWDVRAGEGGNLFTIRREGGGKGGEKVFDVVWSAEVGIVSGGEDKRVQVNEMPRTGAEGGGEGVVQRGKL